MNSLRNWALLGAALGGMACGSNLSIHESEDDNGGYDTERANDPDAQAEAALRADATYDPLFDAASREFGVPAAVLKGLSWAQTRYQMVEGHVEFEGRPAAFGLMALSGDSLTQGAALAGVSVDEAKTDARANVRAAAALLAKSAKELGIDTGVAVNWAPVITKLAAAEMDPEAQRAFVRDEVFGALQLGVGTFTDELRSAGQSLELEGEFSSMSQELAVAPDYPGAVWRESGNYYDRLGYSPKMVVIHTCEGTYTGCYSWLQNPAAGASAHYVVNANGSEISQLVRESQGAWHVGANYDSGLNGGAETGLQGVPTNRFAVGIEHAGFASQATWDKNLVEASAKLTCNITKDWGIPRDRQHIVAHGTLQPWDRTDPGKNWPWATYMDRVNAHCGAKPAAPKPAAASTGGEIIIDSNNANNHKDRSYIKVSANWKGTSGTPGFYGSGYFYTPTKKLSDAAEFWFYLPAAGAKSVEAWWTAGANRSNAAPFVAFDADGKQVGSSKQNQTVNGGKWVTLGKWNFKAGWNRVVLSRWAPEGKVVVADAVRVR